MLDFETGAEQSAYDKGFEYGDEQGRYLGAVDEQERIIKLLEEEQRKCEQAGLFANGVELREQLQTLFIGLDSALTLIKGEK
jgi:uncharacterized protein YueI